MRVLIPQHVQNIIDRLEMRGYEAYVVGGCVRDSIMGISPHDWDITTSALPFEVEQCFENEKVIETGIKHGTVTVLSENNPVEITTFRIDGEYSDLRHPDNVSFTRSLREDLKRRDFTINAMACNAKTGMVDYFGGEDDLKNNLLRCVGDSEKRFNEDALRILRALRFASVYGFSIEDETKKAIFKLKALLHNISPERTANEIIRLVQGKFAGKVLLEYREVFGELFPEFKGCFNLPQNTVHHDKDVWRHICCSVDNSPFDLTIRLTMLLHDIGKSDCRTTDENGNDHFKGHAKASSEKALNIMKRLRMPSKLTSDVCTLVYYHDSLWTISEKGIKRMLQKIGAELFAKLIDVRQADILAQSTYKRQQKLDTLKEKADIFQRIIKNGDCFSVSQLKVNGRDLMNLGIPQGKEIGNLLSEMTDMIIEGTLQNDRDSLIEFVKNKMREK